MQINICVLPHNIRCREGLNRWQASGGVWHEIWGLYTLYDFLDTCTLHIIDLFDAGHVLVTIYATMT